MSQIYQSMLLNLLLLYKATLFLEPLCKTQLETLSVFIVHYLNRFHHIDRKQKSPHDVS